MEVKDEKDFGKWIKATEESRKVVQGAIDALNRGDGEAFVNFFSDDLDFWMPGTTPVSGKIKGKQGFAELAGKVAEYLDVMITLKITNFIACGDWVVSEAVGDALTKKGKKYCNTYCHLWQVKNGKVVKFVEYNDTELIMRVLVA